MVPPAGVPWLCSRDRCLATGVLATTIFPFEDDFYTSIFQIFKIGFLKSKIIVRLNKRSCDFPKVKVGYVKLKIIARLKKGCPTLQKSKLGT